MELRVLQYFLAVVREQSILGAAEALHLSQPTLSRQLKDLEEELGKQLFIRSNRKITLTEEGMILRRRAEEIMALVHRAESEIALNDDTIAGEITIGAAETEGVHHLASAAREIQNIHPLIRMRFISGDRSSVLEQLERGLLDFALVFGEVDSSRYETLELPCNDRNGVLMKRNDPLAQGDVIEPEELFDRPLIVSRQMFEEGEILGRSTEELNIVATYNLLFNGSIMVQEGMGYAIALDNIINVSGDSCLCFRPLAHAPKVKLCLVWKRYQMLTKAADAFLAQLRNE